ncbi:MAG: phosphoesterase [Micavibrio sp.]|nr:MAG: phosphoesterase [Micavibrio sp.]
MSLNQKKYEHKHENILRDTRPLWARMGESLSRPNYSATIFIMAAGSVYMSPWVLAFADLLLVFMLLYFLWLKTRDRSLPFKLPATAKYKDGNNMGPGKGGKAEGILYVGNVDKSNEEVWFTNSDARTHVLYLGTTGSGKTVGLTSLATNAMSWGSGFVYVDGKADTDLWSNLSALVRRFGRDDDLLVLNYMTGNSDVKAPSNTMNPFSSGSASYLVNMLVSLMPDSGGDNAMWAERAVSLIGAMMPVMCWKRDHQDVPLSVVTIRDHLSINNVIKLARDDAVPEEMRAGVKGYLDTLPGFVHEAYDDQGNTKPPGPDTPQYDTTTASQQHGYLAMQFTRSLQSLGDDYGYIFDTQAADVDMTDIVLNRRILVVLIPALEKSGDEIANLGKIVSATMKGMMGSTLGSTVEGSSDTVIENKPTHSSTPFMTIFDEVGYYVADGMAVMAAQARSLGFCLVFSGQDLPAMKKRVREEANSITANCNIKIFGKLEDPTETKEFFEKTVGSALVTEVSGFQMAGGSEMGTYHDTQQASVQLRPRANYDELRGFTEGEAIVTFGETVVDCKIFYSNPGHAKAMRVTRYMALPPPDENLVKHASSITKLRDLMINKSWTAMRADVAVPTSVEIEALLEGYRIAEKASDDMVHTGIAALVQVHAIDNEIIAEPLPPAAPPPPAAKAPAATPPPTEAASPPPAAPPTESKPPAATGAGPMGFFSGDKKAKDKPPAAPPTESTTPPPAQPPQQPEQKEVKKAEEPPAEAPPKTEAPISSLPPAEKIATPDKPYKLPPEIEKIISDAAKNAKGKIFDDKEDV